MSEIGPAAGISTAEGIVEAAAWFRRRTFATTDDAEEVAGLLAGRRVSVILPARDEEATIGPIVKSIRKQLVEQVGLVHEVIVVDSRSSDATADRAARAGAMVYRVGPRGRDGGKGGAMQTGLARMSGDIGVYLDADIEDFDPAFVVRLLDPLLRDPSLVLVKGFYDRIADNDGVKTTEGGRVTELVARPLLSLRWPNLAAVVQPLAGEWAIDRDHFAALPVPIGYGVELATLIDTVELRGLDAVAQVDLGRRAHRHQSVHDLGVMATEILRVAERRFTADVDESVPVLLDQFDGTDGTWRERPVPVAERPPARAGVR
ncbi:glucosyl-3-phosphoglycerate synthase [Aeromicrobium sp.]|uniref:glucosyl-3-phosphoglycerate synthase n=1 Tax=Aeromicrobium sp. TaxID=1871063 RepID=UPI003C3AD80F